MRDFNRSRISTDGAVNAAAPTATGRCFWGLGVVWDVVLGLLGSVVLVTALSRALSEH